MRAKLIWASALLIILLIVFFAFSGQKRMARHFSDADRVVVTSEMNFRIFLSAEESKKLVQAISTAKKISPTVASAPDFKVMFFKGTNHLGTLFVCGETFSMDGVPYVPYLDERGTFRALCERYVQEYFDSRRSTNFP